MVKPLSDYHPDTLHQRLVDLGEDWADKNAAADLLEETKKAVLAEMTVQFRGEVKSNAEAENLALQSHEYAEHLAKMVEARRVSNRAKVNYDAGRSWLDMARTLEATNRAQMNLK